MRRTRRKKASWSNARMWAGVGRWGVLIIFAATSSVAKEKELNPFALLVGSCFSEDGLSLPGAKVRVEIQLEEGKPGKERNWQTVSDARGEFALRLPVGRHHFIIKASREGFVPVQQIVSFAQDERQNVILKFELSKKK